MQRHDSELQRLYGVHGLTEYGTTVNDGPRVKDPLYSSSPVLPGSPDELRTAPYIGGSEAAGPPSILFLDPVVAVSASEVRVAFTDEMTRLLAERLGPDELHSVCKALGARLCLDLYRVISRVGEAEKAYRVARERALRSR